MNNSFIIKKTKCLCSECLKAIDGEVFEEKGRIWLRKYCPEHGTHKELHLISDPEIYYALDNIHRSRSAIPEGIILRITNRCNQHCNYCYMRANEEPGDDIGIDEIIARVNKFKGGVIYISGGEPTVRDDLFEIIKKIKRMKFNVILFSNGKKLVEETYVAELKRAGVDAVILQFDSLSDEAYLAIRGENLLSYKLKAVNNMNKHGICVMLHVNVVEGINDSEAKELFNYSIENHNIRLLFFNPLWNIGRQASIGKLKPCDMLDIVIKDLKLSKEYFIESTRLSTYTFEILRKLRFRKGIKESPCSVSCYVLRTGKQYLLLNSLMDLRRVNGCLQNIEEIIIMKRNRFINLVNIIFNKSFYKLISQTLFNHRLIVLGIKTLFYHLRHPKRFTKLYFMFFDVFSVMVGQFPDKHNIDFSLFKTCNMHTDIDNGNSLPTCFREVLADAGKL